MKKYLTIFKLVLISLLFPIFVANAQLVRICGTGTSTISFPFYTFYEAARGQMLYMNSEFDGLNGGLIKKIAFNFPASNTSFYRMDGFTIKMQNTELTQLNGEVTTGWTTVYTTNSFVRQASGWSEFELTNPFLWTPNSNILIQVCYANDPNGDLGIQYESPGQPVYSTQQTNNKFWYAYTDNVQGCTYNFGAGTNTSSRPNCKFEFSAGFGGLYPNNGTVLAKGSTYQLPDTNHPGYKIVGLPANTPATMTYKISGPGNPDNPDYQTIYTAVRESDTNNANIDVTNILDNITYRFTQARGIAALRTPDNNGGLDLYNPSIKGGEYTAEAVISVPSMNYVSSPYRTKFTIALNKDIAIIDATQPVNGDIKELSRGSVPSIVTVQNLGTDSILGFNIYAAYSKKNADGSFVVIQRDTVRWRAYSGTNVPMLFAEKKVITMPNILYNSIGDYKAEYYVDLVNNIDQDLENNTYPRNGKTLQFNVAHSVEVYVDSIITPNKLGKYYKGVPISPKVLYGNNGFADTVGVATTMTIYKIENGIPILRTTLNTVTGDLIRKGIGQAIFDDLIPSEEGTYIAKVTLSSTGDPVPSNNVLQDTFYVIGALSGEYTIGTRFLNQPRNFTTFKDAENSLMEKGIDGPVTFLLTDETYSIGERAAYNEPGIDFTSSIIGGSNTNWIKFMPHRDKYYSRASINVNILSASGIGFRLGQNDNPTNSNAAIKKVSQEKLKLFANPTPIVIFDGGPYKSIKFNMNTTNKRRVAIYLGNGCSNDTIKNCIFKDISPVPSYDAMTPLAYYGDSRFIFEPDSSATGTFSTAILLKSRAPYNARLIDAEVLGRNDNLLDTLTNNNNVIMNNEISGFSTGIMSLGVGPLMDAGRGALKKFYNTGNHILSNIIYDVKRAGIIVGFEDNVQIRHNVIYNINGISSIQNSAGIIVGGEVRGSTAGYYNTNVKVVGNEIYNVTGNKESYGIKMEGYLNKYPTGNALVEMPDQDENFKVYNNIVRDIKSLNVNTDKFGIVVQAARKSYDASLNKFDKFIYPLNKNFRVRKLLLANNTVVMNNDQFNNAGILAGLGVMNVKDARVYSNAIAIKDLQIDTNITKMVACIIMENPFPFKPGYMSDRNAYEIAPGSNASIYRFIETDSTNRIIELGTANEYANIRQWQDWTFQDMNSKQGNFTQDMIVNNVDFYTALRVNLNPAPPLASILNNSGEQLINEVPRDIDSNYRGEANQRYDIGADEFNGRFYAEDVSVENIIEPRRYQAGTGQFSDAQYIMQLPPYRIEAVTRNNGMLPRSNINARIYLYVEAANSTFVKIDSADKYIGIAPNDYTNVSHEFPNSFNQLFPKSYSDFIKMANNPNNSATVRDSLMALYNYTVPDRFKGMENNVTPRYKLRVQLIVGEQRSDNDFYEKYVRYYVPKSKISMLISGENVAANLNDANVNQDKIAARLNMDSLKTGLKKLGFYANPDSLNNYDVFDRNGWEKRAVDYEVYQTVFWTDGDDKPVSKTQIADIRKYFNTPIANANKRNMVIASQEMAREITNTNYYQYDSTFATDVLRALPADPKTPLVSETGSYITYHDNLVQGASIQINGFSETEKIIRTGYQGDAEPYPGNLMPLLTGGDAVTFPAYRFRTITPGATDSTMGTATTSIYKNIVYLSTDWRHFETNERLLRSVYDFLNRNGGSFVVPVELTDFDAVKVNKSVQVSWRTAFELNASRFELERAVVNYGGTSQFRNLETVKAGNTTSIPKEYGPFVDRNVEIGNKYIYRLKIVDNDGSYSYSNSVEVAFDNSELSIIKIAPNPVENIASVIFNAAQKSNIEVFLLDIAGKKIRTLLNTVVEPGNNNAVINAVDLPSGTYTVVVTDGTNTLNQQIVIKK